MDASPTEQHIVVFPFMSQGHIRPLLDISKALSNLGGKISIITTPSNASSIIPHIDKHPQIHLVEITIPSINGLGLPEGCENTDQLPSVDFLVPFLNSTKELKQPFRRVLKEMVESHSHPICVISDFFLGWTVDTCREFEIPRLVSHGMGALLMAISKSVWRKKLHHHIISDCEAIHLSETQLKFTLTKSNLPEHYRFLDDDNLLSKFIADSGDTDHESWGVILNSLEELEGCHLSFF